MARKQKAKDPAKAKASNVQPVAHVSPVPSPHPQSSPASKHTSMIQTPRGVTPRPPSTRLTTPKSVQRPFEEEEQEAAKWQEHAASWNNSPRNAHQGDGWDEDAGEEEDEEDTTDGGWGVVDANEPHSPSENAPGNVVDDWGQPQEQESHGGGWGGNLISAVTSAIGLGAHSQAQTRSNATQEGVTRKSTLKKKPPANHDPARGADTADHPPASPAAPPATKRVAFTSYSSSFGVRSSSPPLFPAPSSAPLPQVNPKPMHARSQSQGAFTKGWGEPYQPPPPVASGAWMRWGQEAMANEEARKHGMTSFATKIKANVHANPAPPAPAPASMPTSYLPRGHNQPNIASLQSQLHNILNTGAQSSPQQAHGMFHRQQSLPTQMASQTWQQWGNPPKIAQTHQQSPQMHPHAPQMQPANSWGSSEWGQQDAGAWGQPANQSGGYDDGGWGGGGGGGDKASGPWGGGGGGGDDAWGGGRGSGTEGSGGGYDAWGSGNMATDHGGKEKKPHKRGRSKSTPNVGGWDNSPADDHAWGRQDDGGWGGAKTTSSHGHGSRSNEWDAIPEEDEEEYDEDDDDMYTDPGDYHSRKHKRAHSGLSYQYQSPSQQPTTPVWDGGGAPFAGVKGTASGVSLMPNPDSSKTMNFASGRMTAMFELSPKQGLGDASFQWSNGMGLQHAQRALFSRRRLAKDRLHWAFSPENDPRVSSLMRWIEAMGSTLGDVGLQKFLETGQRGALITNADYRTNPSPDGPTQPAFDWITLPQVHQTCDRIFQESVVTYKPHLQVIVFVFLLSNSQNSMAVWRRKVAIPENVRARYKREIAHIMETLPQDKTVYVDEVLPPEPPPPEPPKKKRGFWKRLFGIGRKKK